MDRSPATPTSVGFHFDPVCPFAWVTSRWIVRVAELRNLDVQWRFISLRMVNDEEPGPYRPMHEAGLGLLRVAAAARNHGGNAAVAAWYAAVGELLWNTPTPAGQPLLGGAGDPTVVAAALATAGLPDALVAAMGDATHDRVIAAETDEALRRVGGDVGTPIITFGDPDGPAFFGPVISRTGSDEEAAELWDAVAVLARFEGFAELKRALRQLPDLPALEGFEG